MNDNIELLLVKDDVVIKEALKRMGEAGEKILFVVDGDHKLLGTITDGDIRRWILGEGSLLANVGQLYNRSPKYVKIGYDISLARKVMIDEKIEALPVVNEAHKLVDMLLWNNIFAGDVRPKRSKLTLPVLVMAGGKGTRMDPFTRILPKPLIPLGDKPIIEIILDSFSSYGCDDFYLTLNYKGKMIQSYFDNAECKYNIKFIWEDKPCGTAGGIKLAADDIDAPNIFVSNCDILVKADYNDICNFHKEKGNDITIVGSMKYFTVPYGVLALKNGGTLSEITEKPEYDFLVNTGMYIIKKNIVEYIPADTVFDFPELIRKVKAAGGKIGVYPIGQHAWIDVGQWQEYHTAIKEFER